MFKNFHQHDDYTQCIIEDDDFTSSIINIPTSLRERIDATDECRLILTALIYSVCLEYERRNLNVGLNLVYAVSYYYGFKQNISSLIREMNTIIADNNTPLNKLINNRVGLSFKTIFTDSHEHYFSLFKNEILKIKLLA